MKTQEQRNTATSENGMLTLLIAGQGFSLRLKLLCLLLAHQHVNPRRVVEHWMDHDVDALSPNQ